MPNQPHTFYTDPQIGLTVTAHPGPGYWTHIWNNIHRWPAEGGAIEITTAELRPALEAAYDPTMPNWPAMVEIEDA